MTNLPTYVKEIVALRVRLNWRGKPVLQAQRQRYRFRWPMENGNPRPDDPFGVTIFRDVGRADAIEVAEYLKRTQP